MKHALTDKDKQNSHTLTISEISLSSIHSEPCRERRSLKETILLRKFNTNSSRGRWEDTPRDGIKGNLERSEFIRKKIHKNQRNLKILLGNAPGLIRTPGISTSANLSTNSAFEVVHPMIKYHVTVKETDTTESVLVHHSLVEDSSSDDDVKVPMDELPLNLSDDENLFLHANTDNRSSNRIISVTRTSSRASMMSHRRGSNNSPPNPLYEAAKPRPPPRSHEEVVQENCVPHTDGVLEQSQITTVPYMARSIRQGILSSVHLNRLRRKSRSSSVTSDVNSAIQAPNITSTQCIETVEVASRVKPNGVSNFNNNNTGNKINASANRQTISSGYSSPGSSSTSISPTSSNASSLSSSNTLLRHQNLKTLGIEKNNNNVRIIENKNERTLHQNAIKPKDKQIDEEDIFAVQKWVESSEYKNLSPNLCKDKNSEDIEPKQLNIPYVNVEMVKAESLDANKVKSRRRLSHQEKTTNKHHVQNVPTSCYSTGSQLFVEQNIVSMIENKTSEKIKLKSKQANSSSNQYNSKQRPMYRSRKTASSRNSRAFAFQARSNAVEKEENIFLSPPQASEIIPDVRRVASLSPKSFSDPPTNLVALEKELSASLANLDKVVSQTRNYSTVSGATGRHMADRSNFFNDEITPKQDETRHYYSTQSVCTGSLWSLNPSNQPESMENNKSEPTRKPSFRNRLKGAFSFQNIRRAISMDRLREDDKTSERSISNFYLNESRENVTNQKSATLDHETNSNQPPLKKASSISSIFNTVRMRKRRSRERRNMKARNTIAVDPKLIPEYDEYPKSNLARPKSYQDISKPQEVSIPTHYRPIGRVLGMDVREGSLLVEITKPPSGPYGFYLARRKSVEMGSVYISRLSDSYHDKMFAGLMKLGDEITEINGNIVHNLTLDEVYDIILRSDTLTMRIKPTQVHSV